MKRDDTKPITAKTLYEVLTQFYEDILYPRFTKIDADAEELKTRVVKLESESSEIKSDVRDVRRRLRDMEFDTVTRKQHQDLEKRVEVLERAGKN